MESTDPIESPPADIRSAPTGRPRWFIPAFVGLCLLVCGSCIFTIAYGLDDLRPADLVLIAFVYSGLFTQGIWIAGYLVFCGSSVWLRILIGSGWLAAVAFTFGSAESWSIDLESFIALVVFTAITPVLLTPIFLTIRLWGGFQLIGTWQTNQKSSKQFGVRDLLIAAVFASLGFGSLRLVWKAGLLGELSSSPEILLMMFLLTATTAASGSFAIVLPISVSPRFFIRLLIFLGLFGVTQGCVVALSDYMDSLGLPATVAHFLPAWGSAFCLSLGLMLRAAKYRFAIN